MTCDILLALVFCVRFKSHTTHTQLHALKSHTPQTPTATPSRPARPPPPEPPTAVRPHLQRQSVLSNKNTRLKIRFIEADSTTWANTPRPRKRHALAFLERMQGIHARFRKAGPNATRASVASECGKILLANGVSESVILPCEARMYCIVYHRYTYEVCVSDSPLVYYVLDD
jgi:hypothetical protein